MTIAELGNLKATAALLRCCPPRPSGQAPTPPPTALLPSRPPAKRSGTNTTTHCSAALPSSRPSGQAPTPPPTALLRSRQSSRPSGQAPTPPPTALLTAEPGAKRSGTNTTTHCSAERRARSLASVRGTEAWRLFVVRRTCLVRAEVSQVVVCVVASLRTRAVSDFADDKLMREREREQDAGRWLN